MLLRSDNKLVKDISRYVDKGLSWQSSYYRTLETLLITAMIKGPEPEIRLTNKHLKSLVLSLSYLNHRIMNESNSLIICKVKPSTLLLSDP